MSTEKKRLFIGDDGANLVFTFILVSSLFFLWGVCNGMIDVMDKHFQEELNLNKAQSAWVQFAHYLGYFLMAMPAGWLASKLGYKAGIIAGLLLVALGGFWFIPATHINAMVHQGGVSPTAAFVGFLAGVCVIATGLTFLETIANPYTTVLGDPAVRRHAHQPGAVLQRRRLDPRTHHRQHVLLFHRRRAATAPAARRSIFPTPPSARVVLVLAAVFFFARFPTSRLQDDYHLDDSTPGVSHSIWSHPHFVLAVAAQFLYVAAQAGIFSFFINYMTTEAAGHARHLGRGHDRLRGPLRPAARLAARMVRHPSRRPSFSEQQGRIQPGVGRFFVLPDRAFHRRRPAAEILRS